MSVSQTPGGVGKDYTLSWDAATKSTSTAVTTYRIFSDFGDYHNLGTVPVTQVGSVIDKTSFKFHSETGTRSFFVRSFDSLDATFDDTSNVVVHYFIHTDQTNDGAVVGLTDGDGTHRGVDQLWKFTYLMDVDAYVTMQVYGPGTTFTADANGLVTGPVGGATPVKTLLSSVPRTGESGSGSIPASSGDDIWDSRSSSGVIVPNGIYYLLVKATLDAGQQPDFAESPLRGGVFITVPVDILRIVNLSASGISIANPTSLISYTLTGDANVRMVIAQPGSAFTVDGNGDIQPVNRTTGQIDTSLIVSTKTFQRKAGANTESWDGTSSTGTVMSSGVYPVGLSAHDDYGNHAVDASGNDFPIFTVITLERTVGSNTGSSTASDTTPPTIVSITPADGSTTNSQVSSVQVVLADSQSTLNLSGTSISVRDPNNAAIPLTLTNNGADTITATFSSPASKSGQYTVTVTPFDNAGNSKTYTYTFSVNIRLDSSDLKGSMALFPNPAKNGASAIQFDLSVAAAVDLDVFNILGEKVFSKTLDGVQGTNSYIWTLANNSGGKVGSGMYLVRLKASSSGNKAEAIKKLVVVQ